MQEKSPQREGQEVFLSLSFVVIYRQTRAKFLASVTSASCLPTYVLTDFAFSSCILFQLV